MISGIKAATARVGGDVEISADSVIRANEITLGDGVIIEDGVAISCDLLELGDGCRIAAGSTIVCPDIRFGSRCSIAGELNAELNEHFHLGRMADIGRRVRIVGQGVRAGDHLWMTDEVTIGGGGARGPRSYLTIGDRSAIMDRCFINLSEEVTIGDDTALSNNVVVLTHSLWQPSLLGAVPTFAPVRIGDSVILYVNAIVAPGVSIGDYVTVGAGALVIQDVPDRSMAVGNPARIMKAPPNVPRELSAERKDALLRDILAQYATTLPFKGGRLISAAPDERNELIVELNGGRETIRYVPCAQTRVVSTDSAAVTLAFGLLPDGQAGRCHFDLDSRRMEGVPTPLSEDLRDYLRRRTIRIFTEHPFRPLPLSNLARLKRQLSQPE